MVSNKAEYIVFRMSIVLISKVDEMVLEIRSVNPASEAIVETEVDSVLLISELVTLEIIEVDFSKGVEVDDTGVLFLGEVEINDVVSEVSSEVDTDPVVSDFDVDLVIEETISVSKVEVSNKGT